MLFYFVFGGSQLLIQLNLGKNSWNEIWVFRVAMGFNFHAVTFGYWFGFGWCKFGCLSSWYIDLTLLFILNQLIDFLVFDSFYFPVNFVLPFLERVKQKINFILADPCVGILNWKVFLIFDKEWTRNRWNGHNILGVGDCSFGILTVKIHHLGGFYFSEKFIVVVVFF